MRGFEPTAILSLGRPCNMVALSLLRSLCVSRLAELTPVIRAALSTSTAALVSNHYSFGGYEIYPMQGCSKDRFADVGAKVCQHTNPLLHGQPRHALDLLGR